jgi:tyrosine-protein kinase
MELKTYFSIVRRWLWLLLLGPILGGALGLGVSLLTQPVYRASTTLLVSQAPSGQVSEYTSLLTSERLAQTYAELLVKRPVLEEAIRRQGLSMSPGQLAGNVSVELVRNTQLLVLRVDDTDPARAAVLANLIPEVFIELNQAMQESRYAESKDNVAAQLDTINKQIADTQTAIDVMGTPETPQQNADLEQLQTQLASYRQSYAGVLQTFEAIRLAEAQSLSTLVVAEPAVTPGAPIRPRTTTNVALAGMIGLAVAASLTLLLEYLDDTVKSPEQVRAVLQMPVLGVLAKMPPEQLRGGPVSMSGPRSPAAEAYRSLRTNIQFSALDRPLKKILVASSIPAEGKSTVAANLAVVMAQAGLKVILVDGDLRRPTLHRLFNTTNAFGLSHLVMRPTRNLDGALTPTGVPNLSLVTTGPLPPNPAEMLASKKMAGLLEQMASEADVVIIDSPPISAVTDATVLSGRVDGVVLVVQPGVTRMAHALHAKEQLERAGAAVLGVALNRVSARHSGSYYYYNYHYYGQDRKGEAGGNGGGALARLGLSRNGTAGRRGRVRSAGQPVATPPVATPPPEQSAEPQ